MTTRLQNSNLLIEVATQGAELQRLCWRGVELLWHGDPAWWPRHSPVLFPIVGGLREDTLWHQGRAYRLPKHGFARDRPWTLIEQGDAHLRFRLEDDPGTRAAYPFAFRLDQVFTLEESTLTICFELHNPGEEPLPASLGGHPALAWPLPGGKRAEHTLTFEQEEPAPIRRMKGPLLDDEPQPTPIEGRVLRLRDDLFENDAVILDQANSRRLRYGAPNTPQIDLAWDLPHIAFWTKPGAPYLCLEPWQGYVDPHGFKGEFRDKPGVVCLAPGENRRWQYAFSISAAH